MSEAKAFAENGCEKMLYDIRMGPQALFHDGVIYCVYQSGAEGPEGHPHLRAYDVDKRSWSEEIRLGTVSKYDHHFCPVVWVDNRDHIHVLYHCHGGAGTHLVSARPRAINAWSDGHDIAPSISYPRVVVLPGGRWLMYSRNFGHMGYWVFRTSDDGVRWSDSIPVVDFDRDPHSNMDTWAGTYHSFCVDAIGTGLHISFNTFNEREGVRKIPNPLYGRHVSHCQRYNLYYAHVDIATGKLTTIEGTSIDAPMNKLAGEACKVWDSGDRLANQPAIVDDGNGQPLMLLPMTGDTSPWRGHYFYVRWKEDEWRYTSMAEINNIWDGCWLLKEPAGELAALVATGEVDGSRLVYGGGSRIEKWVTRNGGESWEVGADLTAVDGMLFNNPRPVVMSSGGELDGFFTVFGWEGPDSIGRDSTAPGGGNRGKAYLYGDGEWR